MANLLLDQMTLAQSNKHITSNTADNKLDNAITEHEILDFTSGDITLSTTQFRSNFLFDANNVAAARVLNLPTSNTIKRFFAVSVQDDETFTVTVTNGTGESIVTAGETKIFYTDGTVNDLRDVTAGGGGAGAFIDLTDVDPSSYTSQAGKLVRVNATPDGLEFVAPASAGGGPPGMFQGLLMGSRDAAAVTAEQDKIHIDRLKIAVFDDGAFATDLADLELDMNSSGAVGQLDTGTFAASRWYEVYLIGRSDTDAVGMLGTLAEDWDTDQTGASDDADFRLRNSTNETNGAQSFQPSATSALLYVDLKMQEIGTVPSNTHVWLTVEADASGDPSGTPLATSHKIKADLIKSSETSIFKFPFTAPATLTGSTTYWIVIHADYAVSVSNHIAFRGNTTTTYAGGLAKDFDGASTWTSPTDGSIVDFWFATHMGLGGNNPTLPSPYDRQVKIGYLRSTAGTGVQTFRAIDKMIQWHGLVPLSFNNADSHVLVDLELILPPSMVNLSFAIKQPAFSGAPFEYFFAGVPHGAVDLTKGKGAMETDPQYSHRRVIASEIDSNEFYWAGELFTEGQAIYASSSEAGAVTILPHTVEWVY